MSDMKENDQSGPSDRKFNKTDSQESPYNKMIIQRYSDINQQLFVVEWQLTGEDSNQNTKKDTK